MPKQRGSGYEALPAHDEIDEEAEVGLDISELTENGDAVASTTYGAQSRGHGRSRSRTLEQVLAEDVRHLDAKFKQWQKNIKRRFARNQNNKPLGDPNKPYEILASVFGPVEVRRQPLVDLPPKTLDHEPPMTHAQFVEVAENVRSAIRQGIHPKLNKAGSSGSYFARSTGSKTVGIFKPKDEEPYGSLNPKWTKWFHRNFLSIIFGFGRACLLPNFSYLSEAGAALLSDRLSLYIVPPTELVAFSSPAFFYDYRDRGAYKRKEKPLPEKVGSLQLFLQGYRDASEFLKEHPWPGRPARDTLGLEGNPGTRRKRHNWTRKCRVLCGTAGVDEDSDNEESDDGYYQDGQRQGHGSTRQHTTQPSFSWTQELMADFRFELEKLVILDVLMRNTDRGLDNFMVKICEGKCRQSHEAPHKEHESIRTPQTMQPKAMHVLSVDPRRENEPYYDRPHVHIAAIDNSLSWPVYHPNSWRSYSYGWLFLPSSLIGLPFSKQTRDHFLPILSDPKWWSQTVFELRKLFSQDTDFSERMFKRQIAVLKGQAYNIVQSLRNMDEGPLELCRRKTGIVHDDEVVVADDNVTQEMLSATNRGETQEAPEVSNRRANDFDMQEVPAAMSASLDALVGPRRASLATASSGRPRYQRLHTYGSAPTRPIPVSQRIDLHKNAFGQASGFALMEHMERLQRREEDNSNLLFDAQSDGHDGPADGDGSMEYGRMRSSGHLPRRGGTSLDLSREATSSRDDRTPGGSHHLPRRNTMDAGPSRRGSQGSTSPKTKVVIVERVEETNARPYFNKF